MRVAALHLGRGPVEGTLPPLGRSRSQPVQEPVDPVHRRRAVTPYGNSVVAAGDVDDAVLEAATDAVETITPLRYTKERLSADLSAEDLAVRMRGDLILLAE